MNMIRRIKAISWKESLHILRDARTLYLALILPVFLIFVFGFAVNFDVDHLPVGIYDLDQTKTSRDFIAKMEAGNWFIIKKRETNYENLIKAMGQGEIKIILEIPNNFEKKIKRNELPEIFAILDGTNDSAASVGNSYLQIFTASYHYEIIRNGMGRQAMELPGIPDLSIRVYFNEELQTRYFILPGIIVLIMAIMGALLTSLTIAREWERGTMEQLIATPVRSHEIIIGKLLPYMLISIFQVGLAVLLAVTVFSLPFRGNLFALFFTSILFSAGTLGLGIFFSSILKSQLPAMQVSLMASMLPSLFFSNFIFPVDSMPTVLRFLTHIIPAKYYLVMLRSLFLKGSGFEAYAFETLFLFLFSFFVLFVATKKLVKRVV